MTKFKQSIRAYLKDDSGAAAIEYALLAGLLTLAIIGAATTLGEETNNSYADFNSTLEAAKN